MPGAVLPTDPATLIAASSLRSCNYSGRSQLGMLSGWPSLCKPRFGCEHLQLQTWIISNAMFQNCFRITSEWFQSRLRGKGRTAHSQRDPAVTHHQRHRQPQQPRQLHKARQYKLHRRRLDQRVAVCGTSHQPLQKPLIQRLQSRCILIIDSAGVGSVVFAKVGGLSHTRPFSNWQRSTEKVL